MRSRTLRMVPAGKGADFGLEHGVVGIGEPLPQPPANLAQAVAASAQAHGEKAARMLAAFAGLPEGTFVWTRQGDGGYRLGRVAGGWRYDDSPDARAVGICHVRPALWSARRFGADDVPAGVARAFARGGLNFQRTRDSEAERRTAGYWDSSENLNPALAEARFCPRCGQAADVDFPRRIACPHCGYAAYYNPKPVAAAIPVDDQGRVILLRRGFDPGRGLWTFPGGFVDLGESVPEAAHRETEEELGIAIELGPVVGVYSRADDRVVLIVYRARALGHPHTTSEATEVRGFPPAEIPWDELAFWSTRLALRAALSDAPEREPATGNPYGDAR